MESALTAADNAVSARDSAPRPLDLLALSSPISAAGQQQGKSTWDEFTDWISEKLWGPSCAPNPLYEEALELSSTYLYDQTKSSYIRSQSNKHNCEIKSHADAVRLANEVLKSTGDPFTRVYSKTEAQEFQKAIAGNESIKGIGIQLENEMPGTTTGASGVLVDFVFTDGPADKAGLKPGDRITAVDGKPVSGMKRDDIVNMIRGDKGTQVSLEVQRDGKTVELKPVRGDVVVPGVVSRMVDNDVLYIRMFDFMNDKTDQDLAKALRANPNAKSIIVDLRGNGGGRLDELYQTLSLLMSSGKVFDQEVRTKGFLGYPKLDHTSVALTNSGVRITQSDGSSGEIRRNPNLAREKPIAVLVDKHSASAAELFAGAMKDNGRAKIVGETTFGKGVGQSIYHISDGALVSVTDVRYKTPSGFWAGDGHNKRVGIAPDVEVKQTGPFVPLGASDAQFQRALEVVRGTKVNGNIITPPRGVAAPF